MSLPIRKIILSAFLIALMPAAAHAQPTAGDGRNNPGDDCTGTPVGSMTINGDTDGNLTDTVLVCDGTTWQPQPVRIHNDAGGCTTEKDGIIKYDAAAASPLQYCDGATTSWLPFWKNYLTFLSSGNVGIGTDDPKASLHVAGEVIVGDTNLPCNADTAGALQFDAATKLVYFCTGTEYKLFSNDTPEFFAFTNETAAALDTLITSDAVTLTGFSTPVNALCTGDCVNLAKNGVWAGSTTETGYLPGDTIQVRIRSSASIGDTKTAFVTAGSTTSAPWQVSTTTPPDSPDPFSFPDSFVNNPDGWAKDSDAVTLTGFTGPLTAVCGANCIAIARNGTFGGPLVTGFMPGDTIKIRQYTSTTPGDVFTASVDVGDTTGTWRLENLASPAPCVPGGLPGDECPDDTLIAGVTPDGDVTMYIARCDVGMTWDSGSGTCTGSRDLIKWAQQVTYVTGYTSQTKGKSNTENLAVLTSPDSPYDAAIACADYDAHGHDDWYLPAQQELVIIWENFGYGRPYAAVGNFQNDLVVQQRYWSSSEFSGSIARWVRFRDGVQSYSNKEVTNAVRCARR